MTATTQNVLIRASAGTGKTFALSNRYLALLCRGAKVDEVLATTFTRKAAAQILDRVLWRLSEAALGDAKCAELAEQIEVPELNRPRALQLTVDLLRKLDRLQVMTLDSFFAQVGSRFALELGLPAGWSIADELQDAAVRHEAMEEMLATGGNGPIERLLKLMAKGEARRSVAQMIQDTVRQLYDVYRESGPEAWHRLPHPTPLSAEEVQETIEALSTAPLPDHARASEARDKELESANNEDWEALVRAGMIAKVIGGDPTYSKKSIPPARVALYQKLIAHVRAILLLKLAHQTEATADMLGRFDQEYRQLKRRDRLARFEDITEAVADAAAMTAEGGLAWRMEANVRHLLLDEFQDTSLTQWQAIQPLAKRVAQPGPDGGSLFSVGDVKQAIYGWRGGVAEIFDTLTDQMPGLALKTLDTSYRSAQPIIDTVNRAFGPAMHQRHGNLGDLESAVAAWCGRVRIHTTARNDLPGYASLLTAPAAEENGDKAEVVTLRYAAAKIAELKPQLGARTIGVLVRRNETVARMIHELRKRGVDASEEGGNPLTDSAAVMTLLSLMRLTDHPGDSIAAYHVARSPLGPVVGLADCRDMGAVCALARKVREELLADGYGAAIGRLSATLAASCDARELHRLRQLTQLASDYDRRATLRTIDFVTYVEKTRRQQAVAALVRVMTIHQAKGLEFDAVVLPDLDYPLTGQSPAYVAGRPKAGEPIDRVCLYRSREIRELLPPEFQALFEQNTQQEMDEALSLLYVMLTRAEQALYMIVQPDDEDKQKVSLRKEFAGLLRAALTEPEPAAAESVLYECGDREWYATPVPGVPAEAGAAPRTPEQLPPLTIKLAAPAAAARRAAAADSPSKLEGGPRRTAESELRTEGAGARCRGQLMHAWFEQVAWLDNPGDDGALSDAMLTEIARRLAVQGGAGWREVESGLESLLAKFRKMLARPEVKGALSRSAHERFAQRYVPREVVAELEQGELELTLKRELRIAARHEGRLLRGQADRVVLLSRGGLRLAAEVIDFKTDRFDAEDLAALSAKVEFYRPQIAAYCDAVSQMFRLERKRVFARLLFVEQGVVAEV